MKSRLTFVLMAVLLLTGCSAMFNAFEEENENRQTSSLVKYLYAEDDYPKHQTEIPTLTLPVRVGVAFIPGNDLQHGGIHAKDEMELLDGVRQSFVKYDYIDRIEIIPSIYLANGTGFTTLEQVARLYDVDVMALVSYDQVVRSTKNSASLLYWTIVGAYIIPGNTNATQTFVDTAVFDISTRKLLFRAPGIDKINSYASAVGATNDARVHSVKGFGSAVVDMTANLDAELSRFKVRVKEEKIAQVKLSKGYTGAGGSGPIVISLGLLLLVVRVSRSARRSGTDWQVSRRVKVSGSV